MNRPTQLNRNGWLPRKVRRRISRRAAAATAGCRCTGLLSRVGDDGAIRTLAAPHSPVSCMAIHTQSSSALFHVLRLVNWCLLLISPFIFRAPQRSESADARHGPAYAAAGLVRGSHRKLAAKASAGRAAGGASGGGGGERHCCCWTSRRRPHAERGGPRCGCSCVVRAKRGQGAATR